MAQEGVNWKAYQTCGAGRGHHSPNKTLAATQQDQMNNGVVELTHPISFATPTRLTMARADETQVEVYGSTGAPLERAG